MLVELFEVFVPAHTSRSFLVPAYDVPIIRALWRHQLEIDRQRMGGEPRSIVVRATGIVEARSFSDERARIRGNEYGMVSDDNPTVAVHKAVYPSDEALHAAYEQAVEASKPAAAARAVYMERRAAEQAAEEAREQLKADALATAHQKIAEQEERMKRLEAAIAEMVARTKGKKD